jgi:hypothetical protein
MGVIGGLDVFLAVSTVLTFLLSFAYPIALEWFWQGQTLGKRVLRLQVMDQQALPLRFSQGMMRNLLRCVDVLPVFYLVGGVASLVNRHAQRVGDIAANTIVVKHPRIHEPDLEEIKSGRFNSLSQYPHLAARLRSLVNPREAGIAVQSLVRRKRLDQLARLQLFADIRAHFERKVKFPAEATSGLSDEQYVRNVVEILYR